MKIPPFACVSTNWKKAIYILGRSHMQIIRDSRCSYVDHLMYSLRRQEAKLNAYIIKDRYPDIGIYILYYIGEVDIDLLDIETVMIILAMDRPPYNPMNI